MNRAILAVALLVAGCSGAGDGAARPQQPPQAQPDRTAPAIVSRRPAIGDANALASGPYRVVFTEALDPATVDASAVRVWQTKGQIPAGVALSADGTVLTITPAMAPDIPGRVWIELTPALKDRAGNALVPDATPWVFDLPVWVEPGGPGPISPSDAANPSPSLALDADDEPVVGMANLYPEVIVRFADGAWAPVPSPPSFTIHAWITGDGGGGLWQADVNGGIALVTRFTGSAWAPVGESLPTANSAWDARLVVRAGDPVLLWIEYLPSGMPSTSLHVRAWTGASWTAWADDPGPAYWPSMAVGPNGAIVGTWNENGNARVAWISPAGLTRLPIANIGTIGGTTTVAADPKGNPVVVLGESLSGAMAIRAKAWTGSAWRQIGEDLNPSTPHGATTPAIAMAADGLPVVAWTEGAYGTPRKLYVARFDGSSWQRLGGPLNVDPAHDVCEVALALDHQGAPVLAWPEATGETRTASPGQSYAVYQFHVKRLNR